MIYVRTIAYNAEKTLCRAVNSILNQTYTDFTYYLCDNGSTDGGRTRRIVQEYALQDERIVPFYNKKNFIWDNSTIKIRDLARNLEENDYYCVLDADDEYLPTFFEEMLDFMNEHNIDIACCGTDFFNVEQNNQLIGRRLLNETIILEGRLFADLFPEYHVFMRPVWAKLFKGSVLHNFITRPEDCSNYPVSYGGDTFVTMRAFREAKRVGILAKPLHKYYISPKSVSYTMHPQRVKCDQILHEEAIEYLKPFGTISQRNWDFLYAVYLNALRDTLKVLLKADISVAEKLNGLIEMLTCQYTRQLAAREMLGMYIGQAQNLQHLRKEFFAEVADWLLTLKEVPDEQVADFCDIGEFACAAAEYAAGWIVFQKIRINFLIEQERLDEARVKLSELKELLPDDEEILACLQQLNQSL